MTKLDGTAGQFFSAIADAINLRGTARAGKGSGAQANGTAGFRDLLQAVSNPKHGQGDQDHDGSIKPGLLRARAALLAELDKPADEAAREPLETAEQLDASNKSMTSDHAATADVEDRPALPLAIGQQLAAIPLLKSQASTASDEEAAAPARKDRSSNIRELPGSNSAGVMKEAAESGRHPSAEVPKATEASPGDAATAGPTPAADDFAAVAVNIDRAVKGGAREVLPEAAKVTVVQQETHLPPVQPLTATAQVAKAVVAELESTSAPASSAASNLASTQNSDQPLKILTISLEPPALGNVTVRLRLVGAAVSVQLAADRKDTSQMLDQQRDTIRDLMQSAGYAADVAPVQHGVLDGLQSGSSQSQSSFSGQQQPQSTQGGSGASSGQSQDGARQPRKDQQTNQETRHEQELASQHRRGAVYL